MKRFLFTLWQFTWGLPQNLAGLIAFLIKRKSCEHKRFGEAIVTYVSAKGFGGVSLGMFIFVNPSINDQWLHDTEIHEYGHTIQSAILGPLYLIVVGVPSVTWCNFKPLVNWWQKNDKSYYWLYCEGWANTLGVWARKTDFITEKMKTRGYYGRTFKPRWTDSLLT
ncbi:MAG: hypothetical protein FWG82_02850 [Oscillospiraceae bacterium]|nr:hypothetical protein [Oscillospiraceae bacterium]